MKSVVFLLMLAFSAAASAAAANSPRESFLKLNPLVPPSAGQAAIQKTDERAERAQARKSAGKKMALWGAVFAGTGLVVAGRTDGRCVSSGDCAWNNGAYAVMATGDVVAVAGIVKWLRANRDLRRLETQQRAAGKSTSLGVAVGRRSAAAAYRIRWP